MARPAPKPRKYEMMIVVAPTVTEDGLPNVVERVNGLVEAQGGVIESVNHDSPWGHRRLAYPIQNFRDAFYVLYYFDAAPSAIGELDRELRLDAAIIRHLIVKFDPLSVREHGDDDDDGEDDEDIIEADSAEDTDGDASDSESSDDDASDTEDEGAEADSSEDADEDAEESAESDDSEEDSDDDEEED